MNYKYKVNLPLTKERADTYLVNYVDNEVINCNVVIDDIEVTFDGPDFWECQVISAYEELSNGKVIELNDDEIELIDDQVSYDLASTIDPSDYYEGF